MKRDYPIAGLVVVLPLGIVIGLAQLAVDGAITLLRKLRDAEGDALTSWNMALSGVAPNDAIDKLIEEEDAHAT